MKIFNIDKALELPQTFKVLMNAMDELYAKRQEEFQKSNPLTQIYQTVSLNRFSKTFGSSTGFKQAFEQTVDYASYPGFTNSDGFKSSISYVPFNGKVVFTWQTILEGDMEGIKDTLDQFQIAWQRQVVQMGMFALTGMFGQKVYDPLSKRSIKIQSADTTDGDPLTETKNPVFSKVHTVIKSEGMTNTQFEALKQSNKFYMNINLDGSDPLAYAKLANGLNQIKTYMNKLRNDNGQLAGVRGRKKIVMTEDTQLSTAFNSILEADNFTAAVGKPSINPVKNGFDLYESAYLDGDSNYSIPQFASDADTGIARGFLILDPEYNKANHGPMMVQRLPFSMKGDKTEDPEGMKYLGKQAFDFFCPTWRGIAYVYVGKPLANGDDGYVAGAWNDIATFTEIKPTAFAHAVQVVNSATNPVNTKTIA